MNKKYKPIADDLPIYSDWVNYKNYISPFLGIELMNKFIELVGAGRCIRFNVLESLKSYE